MIITFIHINYHNKMSKYIFLATCITSSHFLFSHLTKFQKEIFVEKKDVIFNGVKNMHIIKDNKGNHYRIGNSIWMLPFYKKQNWDNIKEGSNYVMTGYGLNIKEIGLVPLVTNIGNKKPFCIYTNLKDMLKK